jgi:hypothetical protein
MSGDIMADIRLLEIVLLQGSHKRRDWEEPFGVASKKQLGGNDLIDGCQLPLGLLEDPCIEQIKIRNDRSADRKKLLPSQILAAGIPMLGPLLLGDQTSPTQVLFEAVGVVVLCIGIDAQLDRQVREHPDPKRLAGPSSTQAFLGLVVRNRKGDIPIDKAFFECPETVCKARRRNTRQIHSMPLGNLYVSVVWRVHRFPLLRIGLSFPQPRIAVYA